MVEAPTGVGKTRIALEFVREFWRRRGRCRVLVVVPRRVLAYNPWKKEIDRWMSDLEPKCLILSNFMPPRERMLALSSFQGDFLLMTAIALSNDYILGRIKLDSFDIAVFDEAHRVVAQGEELGQYRYSVHYKQLALNEGEVGNISTQCRDNETICVCRVEKVLNMRGYEGKP